MSICGVVWFQFKGNMPVGSSMTPELVLCLKCYLENNLPANCSAQDFVKIDILSKPPAPLSGGPIKPGGNVWNTEETLRLYEAMNRHDTNWESLAKQFPTHTKDEIILHYMQLPEGQGTSLNPPTNISEGISSHMLPPKKISTNEKFRRTENILVQEVPT